MGKGIGGSGSSLPVAARRTQMDLSPRIHKLPKRSLRKQRQWSGGSYRQLAPVDCAETVAAPDPDPAIGIAINAVNRLVATRRAEHDSRPHVAPHQQAAAGGQIHVFIVVSRHPFAPGGGRLGAVERDGDEMFVRKERDPAGGGHQQRAARIRQADNLARGQPLRRVEDVKPRPVIAKQAVLRADPKEPGRILHQGRGGEVRQSLSLPIHLERVALRQTQLAQAHQEDERNPQPGPFPRIGAH